MATFDELITSLRQEFGEAEAGKKFEVFCKWFLENDPEWSRAIDKVWLWDDYPNKWQRQDLGTDLVFRDKEGLIWAVQAKCYAEHRSTTKGDMNSFLADTGRPEVDRRLWLQTTNKIEAKALRTCKGQDKPVTIFNLNDFREAQIDYPSSFSEPGLAKVKEKPTPDPHQESAIQDVVSGFEAVDRGQMIMACGTGKTFTTLWIKEALEAETTLVLLPSLSLLSQTMREWAWAGNTDFAILNICSDKSVGRKTEDMDPADAAFPVTSDLNEITAFLKRPDAKVVFCTYQSSELFSQAQLDEAIPAFDLAIADEAHRCAGKADAGFATILDGSKIRASKRLFTTATPRYAGKSVKDAGKVRDVAVVGMDDETVFGPVLHKLTFGQAIDYKPEPLLNDYQVVIIGVDEPMVREWIDNNEIVSTDPDKQTYARTLAAKIGLIKAIKDYDLERVISFHSRVKGAEEFSEDIATVLELVEPENRPDGEFLSDFVSGAMAAGDRKEKIDRLKQLEGYDRGILTNARCLAEGVDVPSLDGIAFIDPKSSQIDIIQAVGRAIRKVRGEAAQKKGTIVLPVFIEDGDDHEAAIDASNFKPVWDVLKALRAHDEVLADQLDQYRTNMAKNPHQDEASISDKIIFDLPLTIDAKFSSALRTTLVEATTASWEYWFVLLAKFKAEHGHCNVPNSYPSDKSQPQLGSWVSNQRRQFDRLTPDQIARLLALGFDPAPFETAWNDGYERLKKFFEIHGHATVPADYDDGIETSLSGWCTTQRSNYKNMDAERKQKLNKLNFVRGLNEAKWDERYNQLKAFFHENGHSNYPTVQTIDGKKVKTELGIWVSKQRSKNKQKRINQSRIDKLNEIKFIWSVEEANWNYGFNQLQKYVAKFKTADVPESYIDEDGFTLGSWRKTQYKNKEIFHNSKDDKNIERLAKLNSVGFIWDSHENYKWNKMFSLLKLFQQEFKHCKPNQRQVYQGENIGHYFSHIRKNPKSISEKQRHELDELGFFWGDHFKTHFEKALGHLKKFYAKEKTKRIPIDYIDDDSGFKLGQWAAGVRAREEDIPAYQVKALDKIGFLWSQVEFRGTSIEFEGD